MSSHHSPPHVVQPDLLGGGAEPAQIHRLFFALLPEASVRARIEAVAAGVVAA